MSDATTLTIGGSTVRLIPPKSPTVRLELIQALPGDVQQQEPGPPVAGLVEWSSVEPDHITHQPGVGPRAHGQRA